MSDIFITSDTHFCHDKEFIVYRRGFENIHEHDSQMVDRWNEVVKPDDIVYHLGDIALDDIPQAAKWISYLNGTILLVSGNHDTQAKMNYFKNECHNLMAVNGVYNHSFAAMLKLNKINYYLSHYPTLTSNYDEQYFIQHIISLHGHTHSPKTWEDANNPFLYNVAVDAHGGYPIHIDQITADIKSKWEMLKKEQKIAEYEAIQRAESKR